MSNILITGTTGFIGKNLKDALQKKYTLFTPLHQELDLLNTEDVGQYILKNNIDIVIHAANRNNTVKFATEYEVLDCNLRMYYNLIKYQQHYQKMIYFGSGAEYGKNQSLNNIGESKFGTIIPEDPYGFSKYIMAQETLHLKNIYDLCLFGVYGKYEEWQRRFISNAICRALFGMPITLDQNAVFDYLYIDDLVKIVEWFLENTPRYHRYNITSGTSVSLLDLAKLVNKFFNDASDIKIAKPGWKYAYSGSNKLLLSELGNFAYTDFKISIRKLILFYKENKSKIDPSKLK